MNDGLVELTEAGERKRPDLWDDETETEIEIPLTGFGNADDDTVVQADRVPSKRFGIPLVLAFTNRQC